MVEKFKDISEGMPINTACEVIQQGGKISNAAYVSTHRISGIMKISKNDSGEWIPSNTYLMKVEKFKVIIQD